jgi:hypothetical protein
MRLLWILMIVVVILQMAPHNSGGIFNPSIPAQQETIFPLAFTPLELRKPTSNYSWTKTLEDLTFKDITKFVLELEAIDLPGQLNTLEIKIRLNGASSSQVFTDGEYSFSAPTQIAMVVDTSVRKVDGTFDVQILLKMQWSLSDAGVKITAARLRSFDPQPSFGDGFRQVPLVAEWNSYDLGGIPPLKIFLNTMGFLGNASGSNSVYVSCFIEVMGVDSPWIEFYFGMERIYYGNEASKWINRTIALPEENDAQIPLAIEYHPHRIDHRNKRVTIQVRFFAEFLNLADQRDVEREQVLANIPKIPGIIANFLILNAIVFPLAYFRKRRLEERSLEQNVSISQYIK